MKRIALSTWFTFLVNNYYPPNLLKASFLERCLAPAPVPVGGLGRLYAIYFFFIFFCKALHVFSLKMRYAGVFSFSTSPHKLMWFSRNLNVFFTSFDSNLQSTNTLVVPLKAMRKYCTPVTLLICNFPKNRFVPSFLVRVRAPSVIDFFWERIFS